MTIDFVRGVLAHITAAVGFLIGLIAIIWLIANGTIPVDVGLPALIGLLGPTAAFLFAAEVAKQASKQTARDIAAGQQQQPPAGG